VTASCCNLYTSHHIVTSRCHVMLSRMQGSRSSWLSRSDDWSQSDHKADGRGWEDM